MERDMYRLGKISGKYRLIDRRESQEVSLTREVLPVITDENQQLAISVFGTNDYRGNIENMQLCSFKHTTTAESISTAVSFEDLAKDVLNIGWLQAGYICEASEWAVFNPPVTRLLRNPITDEKTLKQYLDKAKKVNGIYRIPNKTIEGVRDCSFVPWESFRQGGLRDHEAYHQAAEDFSSSGLARGIAYAEEARALNLETFIKRNYPEGVSIWAFSKSEKPRLQVVCLHSDRDVYGGLVINGYNKPIDYGWRDGFAFGKKEQLENV